MYSVQWTLFSVHFEGSIALSCTVYSVQFTLYTAHCTLFSLMTVLLCPADVTLSWWPDGGAASDRQRGDLQTH